MTVEHTLQWKWSMLGRKASKPHPENQQQSIPYNELWQELTMNTLAEANQGAHACMHAGCMVSDLCTSAMHMLAYAILHVL